MTVLQCWDHSSCWLGLVPGMLNQGYSRVGSDLGDRVGPGKGDRTRTVEVQHPPYPTPLDPTRPDPTREMSKLRVLAHADPSKTPLWTEMLHTFGDLMWTPNRYYVVLQLPTQNML